jgi:hypothetical protein
MEEVTEGVNNLAITEQHKKNRIQVSNTKKPLFFYVNLAKVRIFVPFSVFLLSSIFLAVFRLIERTARIRLCNFVAVVRKFFLVGSCVDPRWVLALNPRQKQNKNSRILFFFVGVVEI